MNQVMYAQIISIFRFIYRHTYMMDFPVMFFSSFSLYSSHSQSKFRRQDTGVQRREFFFIFFLD